MSHLPAIRNTALQKIASKKVPPKTVDDLFFKEMKELVFYARNDIRHKVGPKVDFQLEYSKENKKEMHITLLAHSKMEAAKFTGQIKSLTWLEVKRVVSADDEIKINCIFPKREVSHMINIEKSINQECAIFFKTLLMAFIIVFHICIKASSKIGNNEKLALPQVNEKEKQSFTPKAFGIKTGMKYTCQKFVDLVEKGIFSYTKSFNLLYSIVNNAKHLSPKPIIMQTALKVTEMKKIAKEFLPIAAGVSALHANPKSKIMFNQNGFVLFLNGSPIGRFGKPVKKESIRQLYEICKKECGSIPGNIEDILNVTDAEEKAPKDKIKEVFNDFARHLKTNPNGIVAKAAKKIKNAARIQKPTMTWSDFKKSFDLAAKHVKEIDYDPMVEDMAKKAGELNQGRNVLNLRRMNWFKLFEEKKLEWLGVLSGDIMEEEVNKKAAAKKAFSALINWYENSVNCNLTINHVGTQGEKITLTPCRKFYTGKWKIELQEILKGGAKWSKTHK